MRLTIGSRFGTYEIRQVLGAGGMGEVYLAHDMKLGRDVAVKVLPEPFTSDRERLARFEREARTLASLNHPGIGAIYGLEHISRAPGQAEVPALILELVEGDTLADRIRRGPIPVAATMGIARQLVEALDAAHERGIIHRDLKPANIKIRPDETVKVLDFGLAKALVGDPSTSESDLANSPTITSAGTREGVILGTAAYMSPEQARGKAVDKRADIWAFGCVLYEMLTGHRAFSGESVSDTLAALLGGDADFGMLPAATPAAVRVLIRQCLQKDVKRRLRDIADARIELDETSVHLPEQTGVLPIGQRRIRRVSWVGWSMYAIGLAATIGIGWLLGRQQAPTTPAFDRMIRLVSTPAHEFAPVISPDGKWVAYLSDARGPTDVWVKFVAGGDPVNLTASADVVVQSQDAIGGLAVSPDGSQIAFVGLMQSALSASWVIPAPTGGPARRALPVGSSGMQWSPDGKRIAYVRTGGPLGDAVAVADIDGQNEVEVVKRAGGRHVHWIRWSADGKFVYFNHGFQNFNIEPTEVGRVPVTGGPIEPVVSTTRRAVSPFPSPDGRGLFYAANPDSADLGLWWKDLASGRTSRITTGVGEYNSPTMSADGRRLVGTVFDVRQTLERVVVDFAHPVKLEPVTNGFSGDLDPAWSPDGARLVFSSSRAGNRALWTLRSDFTQPAPLTSGTALDDRPAYSPDGQQVAFVSDRGGRRGIWIVPVEAGTPRLVTSANVLNTLSWSPDGRRLVFSTPVGDAPGLMIVEVATGQTVPLPTAGPASAPAWSPRGDMIAYIEPRGGTTGAFLKFVTPTGEAVPFQSVPQQIANGFVAWSPDGRRLAAVALPGAMGGAVWVGEPASTTPFRKLVDLAAGSFLRGITWSRDGSSLVLGRIQTNGDIFFAERSVK